MNERRGITGGNMLHPVAIAAGQVRVGDKIWGKLYCDKAGGWYRVVSIEAAMEGRYVNLTVSAGWSTYKHALEGIGVLRDEVTE